MDCCFFSAACSPWDWPWKDRDCRYHRPVYPEHQASTLCCDYALLFSGTLAQFMSHTAATSILAPVCISIAVQLGISPAPLLMALCQATSIAIATPIGTPPNVIVYGRGGYKFSDFVVTGIPIFIMGSLVLAYLIPNVFSF